MKIYDVAREGNLEEVDRLLKGGADVEERDPDNVSYLWCIRCDECESMYAHMYSACVTYYFL